MAKLFIEIECIRDQKYGMYLKYLQRRHIRAFAADGN